MRKFLLDSSQKKLLKIIKDNSYKLLNTEEIMSYIDATYPQAINNKLKQLENK
jgi:predicted component of type VI protein secretion system